MVIIQEKGCSLMDPVPWGTVLLRLAMYIHVFQELLINNPNTVHTGLKKSLKNCHILEKSLKMTNLDFLFDKDFFPPTLNLVDN